MKAIVEVKTTPFCLLLLFLIYILGPVQILKAQNSSSVNADNKVKLWGYVDAYYAYNFIEPPARVIGEMVSGTSFIYSHNRHNEFTINNGIIGVRYENDKVKGAIALHTGTYVFYNYANEPGIFKNIYEAYAGYKVGSKLWVEAGVFASHIGMESAISFDCPTLSRSIMADNTPYYESGVKATWSASDKWTVTGLILNGWQTIFDYNSNKALGSQVQFHPSDRLVVTWNTFWGKEATANATANDSLSTRRFFNNLHLKIHLFSKCMLYAGFDIGWQKKLTGRGDYVWYNPDLILRYTFSDKVAIAGRGEYYSDKHGVLIYSGLPNGFQTFATSMNIDVKLTENLLWRVEGKLFKSEDKIYAGKYKANDQSTLLMTSMAVKF